MRSPVIAITVRINEEWVNSRILKLAYAIRSDTRRNVTLPNSRMTSKFPASTSRKAKADIQIIAKTGT